MDDLVDLEQTLLNDLSQINSELLEAKHKHYLVKKKGHKKYVYSLCKILAAKEKTLGDDELEIYHRLKANKFTIEDLNHATRFIEKL